MGVASRRSPRRVALFVLALGVAGCDTDGDGTPDSVDCKPGDPDWYPAATQPSLPVDRCALGVPLATSAWTVTETSVTQPTITGPTPPVATAGACGDAVDLTIDLQAPGYAVLQASVSPPADLSGGFLVAPVRGDASLKQLANDARGLAIEVHVKDPGPPACVGKRAFNRAAGFGAWRTLVVSGAAFQDPTDPPTCVPAITAIDAFGIALSAQQAPLTTPSTVKLGAPRFVPAAEMRIGELSHFECPATPRDGLKDHIRDTLETRSSTSVSALGHAFVPSWDDESPARYYLYDQSLLLIVLSRGGSSQAAAVASSLLDAPTAPGGLQPGYWTDATPGPGLVPNEPAKAGAVAWSVIALHFFLTEGQPDPALEAAAKKEMLTRADWLAGQIQAATDAKRPAGTVAASTENNISTWFALRAADTHAPPGGASLSNAADALELALSDLFVDEEGWFMQGVDDHGLASDVIGGWGAQYLRATANPVGARRALAMNLGLMSVSGNALKGHGLANISGPWTPSVEFTAQHIAAGGPGSETLLQEIERLAGTNATFRGGLDDFVSGDSLNTTGRGLSPTAWVWIALDGGVLDDI